MDIHLRSILPEQTCLFLRSNFVTDTGLVNSLRQVDKFMFLITIVGADIVVTSWSKNWLRNLILMCSLPIVLVKWVVLVVFEDTFFFWPFSWCFIFSTGISKLRHTLWLGGTWSFLCLVVQRVTYSLLFSWSRWKNSSPIIDKSVFVLDSSQFGKRFLIWFLSVGSNPAFLKLSFRLLSMFGTDPLEARRFFYRSLFTSISQEIPSTAFLEY